MVTIHEHSKLPLSRLPGVTEVDVELASKQAAALQADASLALAIYPHAGQKPPPPSGPLRELASEARTLTNAVNTRVAAALDTAKRCGRVRNWIDLLKTPLADADLGMTADWFRSTSIAGADLIWTRYLASSAVMELVDDATVSLALPGLRQNLGRALSRMTSEASALQEKLRAAMYGEIELKDVLEPGEMRLALPYDGAIDLRTLLEQLSVGLGGSSDGRAAQARKLLDEAVEAMVSKNHSRIIAALERVFTSMRGVLPDLVGQLLDAHRFIRSPKTIEGRFADFSLESSKTAPIDAWLTALPIGSQVALSSTGDDQASKYLIFQKTQANRLQPVVAYAFAPTFAWLGVWHRDDTVPDRDIQAAASALAQRGQSVFEARLLPDYGWSKVFQSPLTRDPSKLIAFI
jgi:hypothetical protein